MNLFWITLSWILLLMAGTISALFVILAVMMAGEDKKEAPNA